MGATCCTEDKSAEMVDLVPETQSLDLTNKEKAKESAAAEASKKGNETSLSDGAAPALATEADPTQNKPEPAATPAAEQEAVKKEPEPQTKDTQEFTVKLVKDSPEEKLGMSLSKSADGKVLSIKEPIGKFIEAWHKDNPTKKIMYGDQIMSINGLKGDGNELVKALANKKEYEIVLQRLIRINVEVVKNGALGVQLDASTARVGKIGPGALKEYNDKHSTYAHQEIVEGDTLVQINDMSSTTHKLTEEIAKFKDGDKLTLVFARAGVE